jgi:MFS family permease
MQTSLTRLFYQNAFHYLPRNRRAARPAGTVAAMNSYDSTLTLPAPTGWWARTRASRWSALPVVLVGTFVAVLDFFIVNVALPSMQGDLHASNGAIEWVVAGYGLTSAAGLITAGRLGDRYGRRRMFSLGLALFTLASAACGVAPGAGALVAARLVQGLAASLMTPQVLSIIGVVYQGEERVKALSAFGMTMGLAAVGGQLIGGALVQADPAGLGWRTCFLINLPIGVAALALAPRLVPESRAERASGLDSVGTLLVTLGLLSVLFPLVEGRQHGWPEWTWVSLAVAPVLLGAFALHQRALRRRGGAPLLDLGLFRERSCGAGRRRSSWCLPCICRAVGGSARSTRGSCSRSSRPRTWAPPCAPRR